MGGRKRRTESTIPNPTVEAAKKIKEQKQVTKREAVEGDAVRYFNMPNHDGGAARCRSQSKYTATRLTHQDETTSYTDLEKKQDSSRHTHYRDGKVIVPEHAPSTGNNQGAQLSEHTHKFENEVVRETTAQPQPAQANDG